jgi:SAM-dependent methyltransferase
VTQRTPTPAEDYQSFFGPAIFEPLTEHVLAVADPRPGEDVLDLACGTGIVTRHLARAVAPDGRVVGVDLNPAMLEVARSIVHDGVPVSWRAGDAVALELPDAAVDLVVCQQGLQFVPDRAAAARELRRVLRPGGRAVVATWRGLDVHPLLAALADAEVPALEAVGVPADRKDLEAPFSLGDEGELRSLLVDAGFSDVSVLRRSIEARFAAPDRFVARMERAYAAVVPRFVEDPDLFVAYLDRIDRETRDLVAAHRDGDVVVVPMHANLAVAR